MAPQYDTNDEITWLISVTKEDDMTLEQFEHEFHVVHANMTTQVSKVNPTLRHYSQLAHLDFLHREQDQPVWNCLGRLTWESLQVIWAGFQTPQYRASAGKHHFCRLDSVGVLMRGAGGFQGKAEGKGKEVHALVCHRRERDGDRAGETWLKERLGRAEEEFREDEGLISYRLLEDVAPDDIDTFFKDTQFSSGDWKRYFALEEFVFPSKEVAMECLKKHQKFVESSKAIMPPQIVFADAIKVV